MTGYGSGALTSVSFITTSLPGLLEIDRDLLLRGLLLLLLLLLTLLLLGLLHLDSDLSLRGLLLLDLDNDRLLRRPTGLLLLPFAFGLAKLSLLVFGCHLCSELLLFLGGLLLLLLLRSSGLLLLWRGDERERDIERERLRLKRPSFASTGRRAVPVLRIFRTRSARGTRGPGERDGERK